MTGQDLNRNDLNRETTDVVREGVKGLVGCHPGQSGTHLHVPPCGGRPGCQPGPPHFFVRVERAGSAWSPGRSRLRGGKVVAGSPPRNTVRLAEPAFTDDCGAVVSRSEVVE